MAALTQIQTEPLPFTAEPITDAEAAAMFRAVLNLFRLWGVTDDPTAAEVAERVDRAVDTFLRAYRPD